MSLVEKLIRRGQSIDSPLAVELDVVCPAHRREVFVLVSRHLIEVDRPQDGVSDA